MGHTFFTGENPVIHYMLKYLLMIIFLVSGISKILNFTETLIYFAGITNISYTALTLFLILLIIVELSVSFFVWMDGFQSNTAYIFIQTLLLIFLITNFLFSIQGVENCGCFGAGIQSNPAVGILKTGVMILIVVYLRKGKIFSSHYKIRKIKE